jgi:hypothetical protein
MNLKQNTPPRSFEVAPGVTHHDCAHVALEAGEQVTFTTRSGGEYDVARMEWGFYATPSLNSRLKRFGFRSALVKNLSSQFFILLVEKGFESAFEQYLQNESHKLICWLDDDQILQRLEAACQAQ